MYYIFKKCQQHNFKILFFQTNSVVDDQTTFTPFETLHRAIKVSPLGQIVIS